MYKYIKVSPSSPYLGFECNLGLKHPANSCKQVAFPTGVQGKPRHQRALKAAKGP